MLAGTGEHDHTHRGVRAQLREGAREVGDHGLIEGIENLGARHRHLRHTGRAAGDGERRQPAHQ